MDRKREMEREGNKGGKEWEREWKGRGQGKKRKGDKMERERIGNGGERGRGGRICAGLSVESGKV
jgi:hypothetical protein